MESLESKLDRLNPEQRREVEDFADFLLQRSQTSPALRSTPGATPPPLAVAPPPPSLQEPAPAADPVKVYDLIRRQELPAPPQEDPVTHLMREIAGDGGDSMTEDYMDYGQFEGGKRTDVQKRQVQRKAPRNDRAPDLLEWID